MVDWKAIGQYDTEQKCTQCGMPMKRTEEVTDGRSPAYEGYVCHRDKQVTWVKVG
jgi:hypothetical protein